MDDLAPELERRQSHTEAVRLYFEAHPLEWIDAQDLMKIGGSLAFRTRVSECRRKHGMRIENKQDRTMADGVFYDEHRKIILSVKSYYRYVPYEPLGRDASELVQATLWTEADRPFAR